MNEFIAKVQSHPILAQIPTNTINTTTLAIENDFILITFGSNLYISKPFLLTFSIVKSAEPIIKATTNGSLIAIQTSDSVSIIKVPKEFDNQELGIYTKLKVVKPVDIKWHSISAYSSHLLVLDGRSRTILVNCVDNIVERIFNFDPVDSVIKLQTLVLSPDCGWAGLGLFGLSSMGKISFQSPVLPNESRIPREWCEITRNYNIANWNKMTENECFWANEFLESAMMQQSIVSYPLPRMEIKNMKFDIDVLNTATEFVVFNHGLGLVVAVLGLNQVSIYLCLDPILPTFNCNSSSGNSPKLILVSILSFANETKSRKLVYNCIIPDTIFVVFENSVYQLQLDFLGQIENIGDGGNLEEMVCVGKIVESRNGIDGFEVMDYKFDPVYVCLVGQNRLVVEPIQRITKPIKFDTSTTSSSPLSTWKKFEYNNSKPKKIGSKITSGFTYPNVDQEAIREAREQFNHTSGEMEDLGMELKKLKEHSNLLQKQLETKTRVIAELNSKLNEKEQVAVEQGNRIAETLKMTNKLKRAFTKILERLFDASQPRLTAQELTWFQQLQDLQDHTLNLESQVSNLVK